MSTLIKILLGLAVVVGASVFGIYYYAFQAGDTTPLEELVPNEAIAYADVTHVRKAALKMATNPNIKAYGELAKIFGGGIGAMATNLSLEGYAIPEPDWSHLAIAAASFNRQVSCAILPSKNEYPTLPSPIIIAHFQGDAADFDQSLKNFTDSLNQQLAESDHVKWKTQSHGDHQLNVLEFPFPERLESQVTDQMAVPEFKPAYAVIDSRFYASINPEILIDYLNAAETLAVENSLAGDPKFSRVRSLPMAEDSIFFLDAQKVLKPFMELAQSTAAQNPAASQVSIESVFKSLGLLEVESYYAVHGLFSGRDDGAQGILYKNPTGLMGLVPQNESFAVPAFVPSNAFSATSMAFDVGEFILLLKDVALEAFPLATMMYAQGKANIDQMLGMDVETFLDQTFTQEFHSLYSFNDLGGSLASLEGEQPVSQCFVVGLADGEAFNETLQSLLAPFTLQGLRFKPETVGSYELMTIDSPPNRPGSSMGYAIADNKLIIGIGSLNAVRSTLELLSNDEGGAYRLEEVTDALSNLPSDGFAYSLSDLGRMASFFSELIELALQQDMGADEDKKQILEAIDWEAIKNLELKLVAKSYHEPGHISTHYRITR